MRVDHVSYAAEKDGIHATAKRLAAALGARAVDGGIHPSFGTRNIIIPMGDKRYVEVVEALDHPSSEKAAFGQAVRACSETGGGWLGWVVAVSDITRLERRLRKESRRGHRVFPDGRDLTWRQLGVNGLLNDPQLPFFVQFDDLSLHPSGAVRRPPKIHITRLTIVGQPDRVHDWLGIPADDVGDGIVIDFVGPHGTAGLLSVTFDTPAGQIVI